MADEIFVINAGGYIGESTRSEIRYAEMSGKPVRYLEPLKDGSSDGVEDSVKESRGQPITGALKQAIQK